MFKKTLPSVPNSVKTSHISIDQLLNKCPLALYAMESKMISESKFLLVNFGGLQIPSHRANFEQLLSLANT